jgi:hypothetical protein
MVRFNNYLNRSDFYGKPKKKKTRGIKIRKVKKCEKRPQALQWLVLVVNLTGLENV